MLRHDSYFLRVTQQTPTEFWINNPICERADLAILHGASGCKNNPSYTQKMIDHPTEGTYALMILDETFREIETEEEVISEFQRRLVKPICENSCQYFDKVVAESENIFRELETSFRPHL
jgi:transaldolase